jgi:hypothetical protein
VLPAIAANHSKALFSYYGPAVYRIMARSHRDFSCRIPRLGLVVRDQLINGSVKTHNSQTGFSHSRLRERMGRPVLRGVIESRKSTEVFRLSP